MIYSDPGKIESSLPRMKKLRGVRIARIDRTRTREEAKENSAPGMIRK